MRLCGMRCGADFSHQCEVGEPGLRPPVLGRRASDQVPAYQRRANATLTRALTEACARANSTEQERHSETGQC